jgi:signal peptidase I
MELKEDFKKFWEKLWFLLWKDNSLKGWIFSIIFIFVFIKFIFFPVLSLATGTSLPLAIVESCSMYHDGNLLGDFDSWWERHEDKYSFFSIGASDFKEFTLKKGFNKGDILFIVRANPEKLEVGDTIIFDAGQRNPIIHRIVEITDTGQEKIFSTIGDNNERQLSFESRITEEMLVGKATPLKIPYFGWVKLVFYDWKKPEGEKGFCNENL